MVRMSSSVGASRPRHPVGLVGHDPLEEVPHVPGVAEVVVPCLVEPGQIPPGGLPGLLRELVVAALDPAQEDLVELPAVVVLKVEILIEPGLQPRVGSR